MASAEKESTASLRISSSTLAVSDITQVIGKQPSKSHEKGELVSAKSLKPKFREETLWFIDSGLSPSESLEEHLQKIAEFIESHVSSLQELNLKGCDIGVYCCFTTFTGQRGLVLTSDILQRLAMLPIDLVIDMYSIKDE